MRFSLAAALLSLASAVQAYEVVFYNKPDCNSQSEEFSYYVVRGFGSTPHCLGLLASSWPSSVECSYFTRNGADGPHPCRGQIAYAPSFRIVRGEARFWKNWDSHAAQPDHLKCSDKFSNSWKEVKDKDDPWGPVFYNEGGRCRNSYYSIPGAQRWEQPRGFDMWDA